MEGKNEDKLVLVTGGGGYLGSVLIGDLLNQGYKVRLFDNFMYGLDSIANFINHPNLEVIIGDIRKNEDLKKAVSNDVDSVVHLAAIVGDPACAIQADVAVETNFISAIRLARMCRDNGISRFIFASTCSVYGASETDILDEDSNLNPISLYAETKIDAEKDILVLLDKQPAPTILRFGTLYGLSPRMRFDLVINYFTKKALKDKELKIFGGEQWRPFLHVSDAAKAIQLVLESPIEKINREIFNVGSTIENYQMKEISEIIKTCIPDVIINHIKEIKDKRSYRVSFDKIERTLGFNTSMTVRDGILEIKEAIESGKIANPDDPKYYNYHG